MEEKNKKIRKRIEKEQKRPIVQKQFDGRQKPRESNYGALLASALGNKGLGQLFNGLLIQAKLTVGGAGDSYEREADKTAEQIVSGGTAPNGLKRTISKVQAKGNSAGTTLPKTAESQLKTNLGRGHSFDKKTRDYFEPRFGVDLGNVKIHTDDKAASMAKTLNARALTYGNNIAFAKGAYNPGTRAGKKLIAHEVTHTIQQGGVHANVIQRSPDKNDKKKKWWEFWKWDCFVKKSPAEKAGGKQKKRQQKINKKAEKEKNKRNKKKKNANKVSRKNEFNKKKRKQSRKGRRHSGWENFKSHFNIIYRALINELKKTETLALDLKTEVKDGKLEKTEPDLKDKDDELSDLKPVADRYVLDPLLDPLEAKGKKIADENWNELEKKQKTAAAVWAGALIGVPILYNIIMNGKVSTDAGNFTYLNVVGFMKDIKLLDKSKEEVGNGGKKGHKVKSAIEFSNSGNLKGNDGMNSFSKEHNLEKAPNVEVTAMARLNLFKQKNFLAPKKSNMAFNAKLYYSLTTLLPRETQEGLSFVDGVGLFLPKGLEALPKLFELDEVKKEVNDNSSESWDMLHKYGVNSEFKKGNSTISGTAESVRGENFTLDSYEFKYAKMLPVIKDKVHKGTFILEVGFSNSNVTQGETSQRKHDRFQEDHKDKKAGIEEQKIVDNISKTQKFESNIQKFSMGLQFEKAKTLDFPAFSCGIEGEISFINKNTPDLGPTKKSSAALFAIIKGVGVKVSLTDQQFSYKGHERVFGATVTIPLNILGKGASKASKKHLKKKNDENE